MALAETGPALAAAARAPLVLVVEDEQGIADVLLAYLQRDGLRSLHCVDGLQALHVLEQHQPDLLLLDIKLPGMDGLELLRHLRAHSDVPVIMLTAFADDVDRLLGLRLGADDYVTKPFVPAEVVARVRAVLRRSTAARQPPPQTYTPTRLRCGPLELEQETHSAVVLGEAGARHPLALTLTEFRLLACLATQPRRCFSRQALIEACLPESDALDRVIDSHLSKLRHKLKVAGQPELIETVRGIGYRLWPGEA